MRALFSATDTDNKTGIKSGEVMTIKNEQSRQTNQNSLQSLLDGRTEIAETRLAVVAVQLVERLRIRSAHLDDLLREELDVDTQLLQLENARVDDMMGLESMLRQKQFQIQSDRRREDSECWRDLTHVIRDLLNAWESVSRVEAKNRFMQSLPSVSAKKPGASNYAYAAHHYQHDLKNTRKKE